MNTMKLYLEISEKQMDIMLAALDLYSRVRMGQYSDLPNSKNKYMTPSEDANLIKRILMPELDWNAFYGIHSEKISDDARIAWDIQQVMRHMRSWHRAGKDPEKDQREWTGSNTMMGVSYDSPMRSSEEEELPKIKLEGVEVYGE